MPRSPTRRSPNGPATAPGTGSSPPEAAAPNSLILATGTRLLRSRSDLARVFPAGITAATGPGTIGPSNAAAAGFAEFWTLDHRFRFRLSGPVTQIKVGGPTSKTGQSFSLRIWRLAKAAGRY